MFNVCSSVKEGLPYSIIAAMQAGLPIVATKVGGNGELIIDGSEGILVPPSDPEKLAEGIIALLDKPDGQNLGQKAREKAIKKFQFGCYG